MGALKIDGVSKRYADGTTAVDSLNLEIADGEFMVLVGPSGCGKTTALRMVAGLEDITSGNVLVGGRVVTDVPSRDRDIAMVFQNYALYPHLSVEDNMGFGLKLRKVPKAEIKKRVRKAAEILSLVEYLGRKPRQLSGGQRQRVAMGRAIVRQPQVFLMDEPLSNLDAKLRVQMRAEVAKLQRELKVTTLYVTHDQVEAMTMGHRVAVMRKGVLQQVAPPEELYNRPVNLFVAGFIGSPAMNMVIGRIHETTKGRTFNFGDRSLPVSDEVMRKRPGLGAFVDKDVICGIRPEIMSDASFASGAGADEIEVVVDLVEHMGSEAYVHFTLEVPPVLTEDTKELLEDADDDPQRADEKQHSAFIARVDPRTSASEGASVKLVVDTSRMHFFDPASGQAIAEV